MDGLHWNATVAKMDFLASWRRWTLLGRIRNGNAKLRAYSCVSLQKITMPKRNADFRAKRMVCVYL